METLDRFIALFWSHSFHFRCLQRFPEIMRIDVFFFSGTTRQKWFYPSREENSSLVIFPCERAVEDKGFASSLLEKDKGPARLTVTWSRLTIPIIFGERCNAVNQSVSQEWKTNMCEARCEYKYLEWVALRAQGDPHTLVASSLHPQAAQATNGAPAPKLNSQTAS